jgi:hypothetical protein
MRAAMHRLAMLLLLPPMQNRMLMMLSPRLMPTPTPTAVRIF